MEKQFQIKATVTYTTTVTVAAANAEEAKQKFDQGKWADSGVRCAEVTDFESVGEPEPC